MRRRLAGTIGGVLDVRIRRRSQGTRGVVLGVSIRRRLAVTVGVVLGVSISKRLTVTVGVVLGVSISRRLATQHLPKADVIVSEGRPSNPSEQEVRACLHWNTKWGNCHVNDFCELWVEITKPSYNYPVSSPRKTDL